MKETQKQTNLQGPDSRTSRSGGPIESPPDIRKAKSSKNNILLTAIMVGLVSIGTYYAAQSSFINPSVSLEATRTSAADVARELLALAPHEAEANIAAEGVVADIPEHAQKRMHEVEKRAKEHFQSDADSEAILSKCHISGHDVHFINRAGTIMSHVKKGEPLTPAMSRAREIIVLNKAQSGLAVVVKKDSLEVYNSHGVLELTEKIKPE